MGVTRRDELRASYNNNYSLCMCELAIIIADLIGTRIQCIGIIIIMSNTLKLNFFITNLDSK